MSIIAFNKSKAAGFHNGIAKAGIIVGIITTILAILSVVVFVGFLTVLQPQGG